jgi:hypothetical protein
MLNEFFLMPKHTGFRIGQLVQVTDPRNFAYGRIAMVVTGGKGRSQVRFADLPKDVAADPNPYVFVEGFDSEQLEAIDDVPIAVAYALVTITERTNGQEHQHHCLAHAEMDVTIDAVAQAIALNWHSHGLRWSEPLETYLEVNVSQEHEEITATEYMVLSRVLEDKTPPF